MPFHLLATHQPDLLPGYWEIAETEEELHRKAGSLLNEERYASIKKPDRKLEYLASRAALKELLKEDQEASLSRDEFGKPVLSGTDLHVSFSHTTGFGAAVISREAVGLDLELIRPKILRLAPKFLSEKELEAAQNDVLLTTLYWSAKEALYKLYGRKQLLFAEHLHVAPFPSATSGHTKATIHSPTEKIDCQVGYRVLENGLIVTWCTPEQVT